MGDKPKHSSDIELGPQAQSDRPLKRKARLLQSMYRAHVLKQPYGYGPWKNSTTLRGNMLVHGEATGANFLTNDIFQYALYRVESAHKGETIEPYRLFNNMLSSQPMCFNLFFPLKTAVEQHERWVTCVFQDMFPALSIDTVVRVEIEFLPIPISEYINDKTAFDAFIEYRSGHQGTGIIGIETKYTDTLGRNNPVNMDSKIQVAEQSGCFTSEGIEALRISCPQIARNYLLTESYRMKHGIEHSHSTILSLKEDTADDTTIAFFREGLTPEGQQKLSKCALEDFVQHVQTHCTEQYTDWINRFYERYLNFPEMKGA